MTATSANKPPKPWNIHFFQREKSDDSKRTVRRSTGGGMNHRLFCVLERDAADLGGSGIVCIDGLSKPPRTRATTGESSGTAPSSRNGGPCSSSPSRGWQDLEVERPGESHEGGQSGVRLLSGEQPTNRLGLDSGTACELGFGEVEFFAAGIQGSNHRVDLVDPPAGVLVGLAVLGVLETPS
jgi:hypothetical protein